MVGGDQNGNRRQWIVALGGGNGGPEGLSRRPTVADPRDFSAQDDLPNWLTTPNISDEFNQRFPAAGPPESSRLELRRERGQALTLDLNPLMANLAYERPIFHSEADFQHALAWQIHTAHPEARIRLETRPERGIRLDLLVRIADETIAIELKYLVSRVDQVLFGERFNLPNQAAQDISRYDFLKDVARVERFVADGIADRGIALALSNDQGYWHSGTKLDPVDLMFRLYEGREISGALSWGLMAGAGTTKGREEPLTLTGRYKSSWQDYSSIEGPSGKPIVFRYLLFEVQGKGSTNP